MITLLNTFPFVLVEADNIALLPVGKDSKMMASTRTCISAAPASPTGFGISGKMPGGAAALPSPRYFSDP